MPLLGRHVLSFQAVYRSLNLPRVCLLQCRDVRPCRTQPKFFALSCALHNTTSHASQKRVNLVTPLFLQAKKFPDRLALLDQHGPHLYKNILESAQDLAELMSSAMGGEPGDCREPVTGSLVLDGKMVTVLCPSDLSYVVAQWAVWMLGGAVVPLAQSHPPAQLEYFLQDSNSALILTTEELASKLKPLAEKLHIKMLLLSKNSYLKHLSVASAEAQIANSSEVGADSIDRSTRDQFRSCWEHSVHKLHQGNKFKAKIAMVVYTSGTTGKPKGVVHTHGSLQAQVDGMVSAWGWTRHDVILHVLPLHHVHGIVNCLMTPLYCGATCVMLPHFDANRVWSILLNPVGKDLPRSVTVFMAVPTIYAKLIENCEQRLKRGRGTRGVKDYIKAVTSSKIRLMVSGSAALPLPILERWEELTGHRLLERYGMTEIGMALTNPLTGHRVPGAVGKPFPKVEVCIAKNNVYAPNGYDILVRGSHRRTVLSKGRDDDRDGELYVRGPSVFKEYLNKPDATAETFTRDGWFKTGDTACHEDGVYRILGRTSVDIIKSGGYKISALDIERVLLSHEAIVDVAVVGLPDITWGQKVAAVVVLRPDAATMTLNDLRDWAEGLLPSYQLPTALKVLQSMPRNAMGKVNKRDLLNTVFAKELKESKL